MSQAELSRAEEGDVLLADPPSPGGSCGGVDGMSTGGAGKQYANCPAGRGGGGVGSLIQCRDITRSVNDIVRYRPF